MKRKKEKKKRRKVTDERKERWKPRRNRSLCGGREEQYEEAEEGKEGRKERKEGRKEGSKGRKEGNERGGRRTKREAQVYPSLKNSRKKKQLRVGK